MPFRTEINSFLLKDKSIEPKEEVQEDEIEFEVESPPTFPSLIPEFKTFVPKDDYDSDPGALDDDFEDESVVKEEKEDQLDGENQKVFANIKIPFQVLIFLQNRATMNRGDL